MINDKLITNFEKSHCVTIEQRLLYNIQELLKEFLNCFNKPNEGHEKSKTINCKACGGTHNNMGEMLACCRKHSLKNKK